LEELRLERKTKVKFIHPIIEFYHRSNRKPRKSFKRKATCSDLHFRKIISESSMNGWEKESAKNTETS
jgi:hypothetical protein